MYGHNLEANCSLAARPQRTRLYIVGPLGSPGPLIPYKSRLSRCRILVARWCLEGCHVALKMAVACSCPLSSLNVRSTAIFHLPTYLTYQGEMESLLNQSFSLHRHSTKIIVS